MDIQEIIEEPILNEDEPGEGIDIDEEMDEADIEEYMMEVLGVDSFATGFSVPGKTKTGFEMDAEQFKVIFSGVSIGGKNNLVTQALETCYDWGPVMRMFLAAVEEYEDMADFKDKIEDSVGRWLRTFSGWGFLSCIVAIETQRHFLNALLQTWATGLLRSKRKVFQTVKYLFKHISGKDLCSLVPRHGVSYKDVEGSTGRRKLFTFFFKAQWHLEVKFIVEKKRVNKDLVDLSSEVVAKYFKPFGDVSILEIPRTLFGNVSVKLKDFQWMRGSTHIVNDCDNKDNYDNAICDVENVEVLDLQ